MSSVTNLVLSRIGYVQGKKIGTQSDKAKWWLFALGTGIPILTSSLGIIPKLFYPIDNKMRDRMYAELSERRKAVAEQMDAEADKVNI